jgi:NAD(P)-dependent dehydrogenase (short-subunit alcohol dehydrogenase family)
VLTFPEALMPAQSLAAGVDCIPLGDLGTAAIAGAVARISRRTGPIGGLVHLHPAFASTGRLPAAARAGETAILRGLFSLATCLGPGLRQAAAHGRPAFLAVSRLDGRLGHGGGGGWSPLAGGLFGLVKTLRLEWEGVLCRGIDLHPDLGPRLAAERIAAELDDPNLLLSEVGYDSQLRRLTTTAEPIAAALPDAAALRALHDPSRVCLVTGGARGITARCVAELARRYGWRFLLLGRTSVSGPEPAWAAGCTGEGELRERCFAHSRAAGERTTPAELRQAVSAVRSRREVEATLRTLTEAGSLAVYRSVDVTDGAAVAGVLRGPEVRRLGPIRALLHGAGNLADRRIEDKTEQDFARVYSPKVEGLANLLEIIDPERLDHLILFSSVAGFYGNPGQSDYAMANATLDAYARLLHHRHPRCRVLAIGWGAWDGGMVTPELRDVFLRRGLTLIDVEEGPGLLADELASQPDPARAAAQLLVGGPLAWPERPPPARPWRLRGRLSLDENPFLLDHLVGGRPVLPATCALSWMAAACEQLCPGWSLFRCQHFAVLKGIVFDTAQPRELVLDLQRSASDDGDAGEVADFTATLSSPPDQARSGAGTTLHYRTEVRLVRTLPPPPRLPERHHEAPRPLPGCPYGDGGLFHGSAFQGIRRIRHAGGDRLSMECRLPAPAPERLGRFQALTLNPFVLDVQGQGILVWARQQHGRLALPSRIAAVEIYRPLSFDEDFRVDVQIRAQSDVAALADVFSHDAAGDLYSCARGIEVIFIGPRPGVLPSSRPPEAPRRGDGEQETRT